MSNTRFGIKTLSGTLLGSAVIESGHGARHDLPAELLDAGSAHGNAALDDLAAIFAALRDPATPRPATQRPCLDGVAACAFWRPRDEASLEAETPRILAGGCVMHFLTLQGGAQDTSGRHLGCMSLEDAL